MDRNGRRISSLDEQDVIERWHLPSGYAARRRLIKLQTDMALSLAPGKEGTAVKVFNRRISSISQAFVYLEDGLAVVRPRSAEVETCDRTTGDEGNRSERRVDNRGFICSSLKSTMHLAADSR